MSLLNDTPYVTFGAHNVAPDGLDIVLVLVKATFERAGEAVELAEEQVPVHLVDVLHPIPEGKNEASIKYPADWSTAKRGVDVVIVGEAVAPKPASFVDVAVKIRGRSVALRVHGERVYDDALAIGPAAKLERVPIVYERASGGMRKDGTRLDAKNPVGRGLEPEPGAPAPQLEALEGFASFEAAVGLGALSAHWSPRRERAGTFDEAWRTTRAPLMPLDFDARFHNVAHPALAFEALEPDEPMAITGMTASGLWVVRVRAPRVALTARYDHATLEAMPRVDTVVLEPSEERVVVTMRHAFPLGRGKKMLREVRVNDV